MNFLARHAKLGPVLLLALLAVGTSVQVGCGGIVNNAAGTDDAIREDAGDGGCGYDR